MISFFDKLTDSFSCDLAIDLGSTNTVIFQKGIGIVVNEPSVIAYRQTSRGRNPLLAGAEAKKLSGRHFREITVQKPVRSGAVVDFPAAKEMLARYLEQTRPVFFRRPVRVLANVPSSASDGEKAMLRELILSVGAREVYLMEDARALAIGAGLDLSQDKGNMVVDIGGGFTEMAVLAGGNVVCSRSLPIGGEHMDQAIAQYVRNKYNLSIDSHAAEQLKIRAGDAYPTRKACIHVEGYDIASRRPGSTRVSGQEICQALSETLKNIMGSIKAFLGSLSPEYSVDILDRGIVLAGGSVLLPNLDRLLEQELLFPFRKVRDPLTCLATGSGDALAYLKHFA